MNKNYTAQERYQKKVGLIPKTYKLKKELVENFAEACKKANVSTAKQLTNMMQKFIDENNKKEEK